MQPAVLVRLRPNGPWRYGPSEGGDSRLDHLFRSDRLYSAATVAAKQLGFLDEWLQVTAHAASPAFTFSSLFPFQGDSLFVSPPATVWPPPAASVTSPSPVFLTKVRWSAARFVPLTLVEAILSGQKVLADQWMPDPESGCLLRRDRPSTVPFRTVFRTGAAIDRLSQTSASAYTVAGVEFEAGAGLWSMVRFADEAAAKTWGARIKGIFKWMADTGLGGRRSVGWGHAASPEFQDGTWPQLLFPKMTRRGNLEESTLYWLLSLYSPAATDDVDWSGGAYELVERRAAVGKRARFITEGSVLSARESLVGAAVNTAKDGSRRAIYRSGFALALRLPVWPEAESPKTVEEPAGLTEPEHEPGEAEAPVHLEEAARTEEPASDV